MKNPLYFLLGMVLLMCVSEASSLVRVSSFEGGSLYKAGNINVVVMNGSFYSMGRQYGGLLKAEFAEFYDMAAKQAGIGTSKAPYKEVVSELKSGMERVPFYVREWVRGMGETSGLGEEKQLIASNGLALILMQGGACSGMIAWGQYSKDGSTVIGRNWDLGTKTLKPYQKFLTVAVFNPSGSSQSVADINYIGQFLWQSGINRSGLFYDLQNGGMCDPQTAKRRLNSNSALMSMMLDSTSFDQVEGFFDAVRSEGGLLINAADAKQGACFEWGTSDYRKRVDDEKGLVASANNFTCPTWNVITAVPEGKYGGFTKERTGNLLKIGKRYKGRIDAGKMMEIFSSSIPDGGPSFPEEGDFMTYYSIVAVPKELKLWLNVRGFQGWTEIELEPLFSGR
ncbi:MAG: C45 family autoproteolytic acyltransferase/hydrolase [Candidatus Margulisiibacteriota bacterium]